MRSTRVRPMVDFDGLDSTADSAGLLDRTDEDGQLVQNGYTRSGRHDYLVRQAFLRSYQFSVKESFKEKIKRSITEVNDVAKAFIADKIKRTLKKITDVTKAIVVDMRIELNEKAKAIFSKVRREISEGRLRARRAFRFRLPVPAYFQCFTPRGN